MSHDGQGCTCTTEKCTCGHYPSTDPRSAQYVERRHGGQLTIEQLREEQSRAIARSREIEAEIRKRECEERRTEEIIQYRALVADAEKYVRASGPALGEDKSPQAIDTVVNSLRDAVRDLGSLLAESRVRPGRAEKVRVVVCNIIGFAFFILMYVVRAERAHRPNAAEDGKRIEWDREQ